MKVQFTFLFLVFYAYSSVGQEIRNESITEIESEFKSYEIIQPLLTIPFKRISRIVKKRKYLYCNTSTITFIRENDWRYTHYCNGIYIFLKEKIAINYSHYSECPQYRENRGRYNQKGKTPELMTEIQDLRY